jgi:hypothetical protein
VTPSALAVLHRDPGAVWKRLLQKVNLLSCEFDRTNDYASNIAPRLGQACNVPSFKRIEIDGKHDDRSMATRAASLSNIPSAAALAPVATP